MRIYLKSIYFRVLLAFMLIIIFALVISTIIELRLYASELPVLFTEIRTKTAAQQVSSVYNRNNGWDGMDIEIQRLSNLESLNSADNAIIRMIVRDSDGRTVFNSFSSILTLEDSVLLKGESQPIVNFNNGKIVGEVTLYIGRDYINEHIHDYTRNLLRATVIKGLITGVLAVLISLLISKRITGPVIRLTSAARHISEGRNDIEIKDYHDDEIGELNRTFSDMVKALNNQRESRRKLLTDISHEINTPLNSIKLESRALSDGLVSAADAGRQIIAEVDSLRNIIYDLDWLAESDSGSYFLNRKAVTLHGLLEEEVARWKFKAESRGIGLEMRNGIDDGVKVYADPVRLGSVLSNLLSNAIKYSPDNSSIAASIYTAKGLVTVCICDNGPLISEEYRDKIFERKFRSPVLLNGTEVGGNGLGLAIAKEIVEMHGGRLWLECSSQTGNCFCFSLFVHGFIKKGS